ncbi:MAG: nucleotidyltransferase family protein [Candidatus Sungbacteria bacterium]|nr:nucleotidyltransferase family protein [Candidatus Sungbacteria bacterium]
MSDFEEIKQKVGMVLRQAGIKRAAVFGSFARGQANKESDIDLLVEFEGQKTLLDLVALKTQLRQMLGINVDLITYQSLSPLLRDSILREQIPLYG